MATQQSMSPTGRNRGARKGSKNDRLNIGKGIMSLKDQTPAVKITPQIDTDDALKEVRLTRKTLDKAAEIIKGFHKANEELQSLKEQTEAKRGGLSDIIFKLCKIGIEDAPKPELRYAACRAVLDSAEAYERTRYKEAQGLDELPTAKVALGSSWQTYKSQILRCVKAGLNPADFENGTKFREAASNTGNGSRNKRGARQTKSTAEQAAAETMSQAVESVVLRVELAAAITDFINQAKELDEVAQMKYANKLHALTKAIAKEKAGKTAAPKAKKTGTTDADADSVEAM